MKILYYIGSTYKDFIAIRYTKRITHKFKNDLSKEKISWLKANYDSIKELFPELLSTVNNEYETQTVEKIPSAIELNPIASFVTDDKDSANLLSNIINYGTTFNNREDALKTLKTIQSFTKEQVIINNISKLKDETVIKEYLNKLTVYELKLDATITDILNSNNEIQLNLINNKTKSSSSDYDSKFKSTKIANNSYKQLDDFYDVLNNLGLIF